MIQVLNEEHYILYFQACEKKWKAAVTPSKTTRITKLEKGLHERDMKIKDLQDEVHNLKQQLDAVFASDVDTEVKKYLFSIVYIYLCNMLSNFRQRQAKKTTKMRRRPKKLKYVLNTPCIVFIKLYIFLLNRQMEFMRMMRRKLNVMKKKQKLSLKMLKNRKLMRSHRARNRRHPSKLKQKSLQTQILSNCHNF